MAHAVCLRLKRSVVAATRSLGLRHRGALVLLDHVREFVADEEVRVGRLELSLGEVDVPALGDGPCPHAFGHAVFVDTD